MIDPKRRAAGKVSIVIPVYYNEDTLQALYEDLLASALPALPCEVELVFVDDGSGDGSWGVLQRLAEKDPRVRALRLSRNFGSFSAILCGLVNSTGDCACVKAADLQEPSSLIPEMYESWAQGNNVVLAVRRERADKSLFSEWYYGFVAKVALPSMPKGGFDIFLADRKVIEVLARMDERNSALTGQLLWSGFRTGRVYYSRLARTSGESRWTFRKRVRLFMDTFFSFTTLPITIVSIIGVCSALAALIWAVLTLAFRLAGLITVAGWTQLFIFNLFAFGVVMLTLGLLGGYLWRTFEASRNRPGYIVEEEAGGEAVE
jgi:dolichol-phosphate mannosyltransferase